MAKKNQNEPAEIEQPEITSATIAQESPSTIQSIDVQKTTVCIGGYNHAAIRSGDTLEIASASLPKNFSMAGINDGYFPGAFPKRFAIAEHSRDEKILCVKIAPQP